LALGTPRAVSARATPRSVVTPLACISRMMGSVFAANWSALVLFRAAPSLTASACFGPPSLTPRCLAAASACLVPLADGLALVFGDGGQDVDGEFVGVRVVGCDELDAGIHQRGDEGKIAGQAVEFGNDQFGLLLPAGRQRLFKLGAGIALATFDLGMFGDE